MTTPLQSSFWIGVRDRTPPRQYASSIRIPDPRPDTPDRRIETNPQPLRVPLFDLTDVEPKTKKEPKKP